MDSSKHTMSGIDMSRLRDLAEAYRYAPLVHKTGERSHTSIALDALAEFVVAARPVAASQLNAEELAALPQLEALAAQVRDMREFHPWQIGQVTKLANKTLALIEHARRAITAIPHLLNADELAALCRFDECAQDGEGWDVPKEMMQRLAEIGVVRRKSGNFYEVTDVGQYVLGRPLASKAVAQLVAALRQIDKEVSSSQGSDLIRYFTTISSIGGIARTALAAAGA